MQLQAFVGYRDHSLPHNRFEVKDFLLKEDRRPIGDAYAELQLLPQGHGSANAKHLRGAEYAKNLLAVMAAC